MIFFFYLLLINGASSLSLQPAKHHSLSLLEKIRDNPQAFIDEMSKVDPAKVKDIIGLLNDLLQTSNERENELTGALSAAKAATVSAAVDVSDAGDAKDSADEAVTTAEGHLDNVNAEEATRVSTAEGVLSTKENAAAQAQVNVDAKKAEHSVKVGEQDHAQNAYDGAKPQLDSEQATLTDVILLLKGLQATNDYTLSVQTGTNTWCDGGRITVKFKVNGLWTEKLEFVAVTTAQGETVDKIFALESKPSAVIFTSEDGNGWCYVDGTITKGHEESSVTFVEWGGDDGPAYHDNGFSSWWVDGDEAAPVSNEYQINWGSDWEAGWCLEPSGADSQATQASLGTWSQPQCLTKCNQQSNAQGCEWKTSNACYSHGVEIGSGSGAGTSAAAWCNPM